MQDRSPESIVLDLIERRARASRETLLDEACGHDPALRREVESLLAVHEQLAGLERGKPVPVVFENVGDEIGPYRLERQIGQGGMGTVWAARQSEPVKRQVALKLIKPGMDSKQVLVRFEAERQTLARMDHPHIARVFDGGVTPTGRPYFVMELVEGEPLIAFCDSRKLDVRRRLELFRDVCLAVQHAHQKGIIHRDLKPSNILATDHDGRYTPRIIDFGLAKAIGGQEPLSEATLELNPAVVAGTPTYMAPEQAGGRGQDIDTRADIYALGAILYELLAGTPPFDRERLGRSTWDETLTIIRSEEPPRPSSRLRSLADRNRIAAERRTTADQLPRLLRGDLDWIISKAIAKDRNLRYDTARGLALDVERHLAGEPVLAGPPSTLYRVRKFLRRHWVAASAASLVLLSLVLGLIGTSVGLMRAREERLRAEKSARAEAEARLESAAFKQMHDELVYHMYTLGESIHEGRMNEALRAVKGRIDFIRVWLEARKLTDPAQIFAARTGLARAYRAIREWKLAREESELSLQAARQLESSPGPRLAWAYFDLSAVAAGQGNAEEAARFRALFEETLEAIPDELVLSDVYDGLTAYFREGAKEGGLSLRLARRSYDVRLRKPGIELKEVIWAQHQMAWASQRAGFEAEALDWERKAIRNAVANGSLSGSLARDANQLMINVLFIDDEILAATSTIISEGERLRMIGLRGLLRLRDGRWKPAEDDLRPSLEWRLINEPDNWGAHGTALLLGAAIAAQGRIDEGEPLMNRGFDQLNGDLKRTPEDYRTRLAMALNGVPARLKEQGRADLERRWLERIDQLRPPPVPPVDSGASPKAATTSK